MKANNATEKRKGRQYKVTDSAYGKAMKKAAKSKVHVANILEDVVRIYGDGGEIQMTSKNESISYK